MKRNLREARSSDAMGPLLLATLFLAFFASAGIVLADERVTVLRVGVLIDGNGGEPVKDAVIVIQGKRIVAVGKSGEVSIPKGAQLLHLKNKTAIPGLVDTHAHYRDWQGEIYLSHGVTTAFDIGSNPLAWSFAQKEGIDKGKIVGPRLLLGGRINGPGDEDGGEGGSRGQTDIVVNTPDQAREQVRRLAASGVDIIKALENLSPETLKAVAEEAHRAGKPVFAHSINGTEAVLAGADIDSIEHSHSVAMAAVTTEEARKKLHEGRTRRSNRLTTQEIHSFMEEESYNRLIEQLVAKKVHWSPTLATTWRAFSPQRESFRTAELKLFSLPGLSYIPAYFRANTKEYFVGTAEIDRELRERIQSGHKKLNDFIRRFVKAGGKLQTGSDPNSVLPGMAIHREMELLVEAGLTPTEALTAATKNPAERMGRQKDFGMITPGAFADIVVVDGNPLQEISSTQRIHLVFKEGRQIKPEYHAGYRNPIPRPQPDRPAPEIESISPDAITEGSGPVTLTITGRNFLSTALVKVNGKPLPAEVKFRPSRFPQNFRRSREITATIAAENLRRYGSYPIVVEHPGAGGAVSNTMYLIVKPR